MTGGSSVESTRRMPFLRRLTCGLLAYQYLPRRLPSIVFVSSGTIPCKQYASLTAGDPEIPSDVRYCIIKTGLHRSYYYQPRDQPHGTLPRASINLPSPPVVTYETHASCVPDVDESGRSEMVNQITLYSKLNKLSSETEHLSIRNNTPTHLDWQLLSNHFTSVKELHMDSGFEGDLNDKGIPTHWPLERLILTSATGELVHTDWILDGKVRHLTLACTGLRFAGPSNREFQQMYRKQIDRGEEGVWETEGIWQNNGMVYMYLPQLTSQWLSSRYHQERAEGGENPGGKEEIIPETDRSEPGESVVKRSFETLDIIENDAHDTLFRLAVTREHLFVGLKTLNFQATNGHDCHLGSSVLLQLLPKLEALRSLTLTLGNKYDNPECLTTLYKSIPPGIETLRFRSTTNLAKALEWEKWVKAFENPDYLPRLQRLSFVLDLEEPQYATDTLNLRRLLARVVSQGEGEGEDGSQEGKYPQRDVQVDQSSDGKAKDRREDLRKARRACKQLWEAARGRGVCVEPFVDPLEGSWTAFRPIDPLWDRLHDG